MPNTVLFSFVSLFSFSLLASGTHLTLPDLASTNIVGVKAGIRPYRENGIRIEAEQLGEKIVIHNYGHGGAGISLAPGTVKEALSLLPENINKDQIIAVMGAGVIGLTTANELLELGYSVRIYSADFTPNTTSEVAAGLWDVFGVNLGDNPERANRITKTSLDYFTGLSEAMFPGIFAVDVYAFRFPQSHFAGRNVTFSKEQLSDGRFVDAARSRALMIETPKYISFLHKRAERRGAQFIKQKFANKDELRNLREPILFNCLGLGAKEVFDDQNLKPIRGQLIHFKKQDGIDYVGVVKAAINSTYVCVFPYRDRFILGGSYEVGESEAVTTTFITDAILHQARAFFNPQAAPNDEL